MVAKLNFSPDQAADICRRYTAGETSDEIAVRYDCSPPPILRVLRENRVPIRVGCRPPIYPGDPATYFKTCKDCRRSLRGDEFYGGHGRCRRCYRIREYASRMRVSLTAAELHIAKMEERAELKASGRWRCRRCGEVKPLTEFRHSPDGRIRRCLVCDQEDGRQKQKAARDRDFTRTTWLNIRRRHRVDGIPMRLGEAYLFDLFNKQGGRCAMTGLELYTGGDRGNPLTASIDRIVPAVGYVEGNLRWVCFLVNIAMRDWGEEPLNAVVRAYLSHRQARGLE